MRTLKTLVTLTAVTLAATAGAQSSSSGAATAAPLCASPAERAAAATLFARERAPATHQAAAELKIPEAKVVSALPAAQAHGVSPQYFQQIWRSLERWETAVFVVMKAGHVFETYGKVFHGEPSKRSNFFNLHGEGAGISGHLRPDLLGSIYAVEIPGKDAVLRGVLFYDRTGEIAFGVYVPGEGYKPSKTLLEQFAATNKEIRSWPALCPAS
jgi:putative heme iron utilization protein